jgi:hypothetical protein
MPQLHSLFIALVLTLDLGTALCQIHSLGQLPAVAPAIVLLGIATKWLRSELRAPLPLRAPLDAGADVPRWLVAVMLALWSVNWLALSHAPYRIGLVQEAILGAGGLFFLLELIRGVSTKRLVLGTLVLGVALRGASYGGVPIDPNDGDMMPLVKSALSTLLAGQCPYRLYHMPWDLPLVYPPVTWLAYLPAYALGLDVRITNLALELGIAALAYICVASPARRQTPPSLGVLAPWAVWFVSPSAVHWSLHIAHLPFWFLALLTLVLLQKRREQLAALAFGLCLASSPLAAVIAPFLLIFLLRNRTPAWALRMCLSSLAVAGALYLPFVLWDREAVVLGLLGWHNIRTHIAYELWKLTHGQLQIGFAGLFVSLGLDQVLKPLQALGILGLCAAYYARQGRLRLLGPMLVAAFLFMMVANPLIRGHYYGIALVLALYSLACAAAPSQKDVAVAKEG